MMKMKIKMASILLATAFALSPSAANAQDAGTATDAGVAPDAGTATDAGTAPAPVRDEDIPCIDEDDFLSLTVDLWTVNVPGGSTLGVRVDTVSADTTFDPALAVQTPSGTYDPEGSFIAEGDDEFSCTFPPPDFDCPELSTTEASGEVEIVVINLSETIDCTVGEYDLTVTIDGVEVTPTLSVDDLFIPSTNGGTDGGPGPAVDAGGGGQTDAGPGAATDAGGGGSADAGPGPAADADGGTTGPDNGDGNGGDGDGNTDSCSHTHTERSGSTGFCLAGLMLVGALARRRRR